MMAAMLRTALAVAVAGAVLTVPLALLALAAPALRRRYTAAAGSSFGVWLAVLLVAGPLCAALLGPVLQSFSAQLPVQLPVVTLPPAAPQQPGAAHPVANVVPLPVETQPVAVQQPVSGNILQLAALLWLVVCLVLAVHQLLHWLYWRVQCTRWAQPVPDLVRAAAGTAAAALGLRRLPQLQYTGWVDTPVLTGVLRPVLLLPLREYPPDTLLLVLTHELAHLRRHEPARQLLYTLAETVHWYHPLVWRFIAGARHMGEQACDARVLQAAAALPLAAPQCVPAAYAAVLLEAMPIAGRSCPAVGLLGSARRSRRQKQELEDRMKQLFDTHPRKRGCTLVVLLLTLLTAAVLFAGCAASAGVANTADNTREQHPALTVAPPIGQTAEQADEDTVGQLAGDTAGQPAPQPAEMEPETLAAAWQWPLGESIEEYITRAFDAQAANPHTGLDIAVPTGTPVLAASGGTVQLAQNTTRGHGNYIIIDHGNGCTSLYAHCNELLVQQGDTVSAGDTIATVGNTGNSTGPHLHLEIAQDGAPLDPLVLVAADGDVLSVAQMP